MLSPVDVSRKICVFLSLLILICCAIVIFAMLTPEFSNGPVVGTLSVVALFVGIIGSGSGLLCGLCALILDRSRGSTKWFVLCIAVSIGYLLISLFFVLLTLGRVVNAVT